MGKFGNEAARSFEIDFTGSPNGCRFDAKDCCGRSVRYDSEEDVEEE